MSRGRRANAMDVVDNEKQEKQKKRSDWDIRPYLAIGALIFLVFCCCIAVFTVIFKYAELAKACSVLLNVLQPILIGVILGYLFNPLLKRIDSCLCALILPRVRNRDKAKRTVRAVASIMTLVIFLLMFGLVVYLVVPALFESIANLVATISANVAGFIDWYNNLSVHRADASVWEDYLVKAADYLQKWFNENVLPKMSVYVGSLTHGAINIVMAVKNIVIGLVVSIYVLMDKERFAGQAKKMLYAVLPVRPANNIIGLVHKIDEIFGGFIIGKLIDSAIIGVLCFIGCWLLRMPYALLVSVIVGITNVIPIFGPFIGAIPCLIIVTITDPLHGLYLLIFIILLQQVDGNIIGPKILGDTTGLSAFWVMFAILVGGGLFGFAGMLLGVPTFAVIYYLLQQAVAHLLKKKGLSPDTRDYERVTYVDPESKQLHTDGRLRGEPFRFHKKPKIKK